MPPMTRLRVSALEELARQLRFIPPATARRHLERTEALLPSVDAARAYPEDWIAWKITGYRGEVAEPAVIAGEALLGDLPGMIERLSAAAKLKPDELSGWLTTAALCERWSVDRRTLQRYRRLGLAGRRARGADRRSVVLYDPAHVAWFESRHADRLGEAGRLSRIDEATGSAMLRRATRYHARLGWSRLRIARRLAERYGRSVEAVRRRLAEAEEAGEIAGLRATKRLGAAEAGAIVAKLRQGAEPAALARASGKSAASVQRLWLGAIARGLRSAGVQAGKADGLAERGEALLRARCVREGLGGPGPATVAELVEQAMTLGWPDAQVERERAGAYWLLRERAGRGLMGMEGVEPSAGAMDRVLTDLRWAARLKAELVRSEWRATLEAIRGHLGRGIEELPAAAARGVVNGCTAALIDAVERFDPARGGGRLAAPAGMGVSRALARWAAEDRAGAVAAGGEKRARAVGDPGAIGLEDWTQRVEAWSTLIEPPDGVREGLGRVAEVAREVLVARMGWSGAAPMTVDETAEAKGMSAARVVRLERRAVREGLGAGGRVEGGGGKSERERAK
jgi:RNA polymerase primary sigma factor